MIGMIWAESLNGVIGRNGAIPWDIPEDVHHFRETTMDSTIIMGRKTWESFGGVPLIGRRHMVVSKSLSNEEGVEVYSTLLRALQAAEGDTWLIGGERIYTEGLKYADRIVVTSVSAIEPGDTIAPVIPIVDWYRNEIQDWTWSPRGNVEFRIDEYRKMT